MKYKPIANLDLSGLTVAPPQLWKNVRLYPVLREEPTQDLRFAVQSYEKGMGIVSVDNSHSYASYIPHGLVVSWEKDGPQTTYGTALHRSSKQPRRSFVTMHHRMVKKRSKQLRILPLHLAMEGFLNLQVGVPQIAWPQYSKEFKRWGLASASASVVSGAAIEGLSEAAHLFEIHEKQVGVLIFIADALAGAFIVSNPQDYRLLHDSLVQNFYSELFQYYACYEGVGSLEVSLKREGIATLADLETAIDGVYSVWEDTAALMSAGLFANELRGQSVNKVGPYQLSRFMTRLKNEDENHMGEVITNKNGGIEYLSTYRLTKRQTRRAYLLKNLADHEWNIESTATAMGQTVNQLLASFKNNGFSYLLNPEILKAASKQRK